MEILDIVDENGNPTGKTEEREKVHELGLLHRTSHVWIFQKANNKLRILLQMRSSDKDSFPNCYDISSAGHIGSGEGFTSSAVRELKEELGINAKESDLHYCGLMRFFFKQEFYNKMFTDNQISAVYYMFSDKDENDFFVQKSEISYVKWFDFDECIRLVNENKIPNCININELDLLKEKLSELKY